MTEDDALYEAIEDMVNFEGNVDFSILESLVENLDLPKIIVSDDSISVLDEDWVEKNVEKMEGKEDEVKKDFGNVKGLSGLFEGKDDIFNEKEFGFLEEGERVDGEFYKSSRDIGEFYDSREEGESYEVVEGVIGESVEFDDVFLGGRSMLEVAGFRDFDREKERERKREDFI